MSDVQSPTSRLAGLEPPRRTTEAYDGMWDRTMKKPMTGPKTALHVASLGVNTIFLSFAAYNIAKDKQHKQHHVMDIIAIVLSSLAGLYSGTRLFAAIKQRSNKPKPENTLIDTSRRGQTIHERSENPLADVDLY